jgi:diguanylate cyclase (GGDEF)-like protein
MGPLVERKTRTLHPEETKIMDREIDELSSIEQEELRGISRSVAEIEWLLLIVVLLYYVFGGTEADDKPVIALAMVLYAAFVMGFRYARFFKRESRGKLAVETWVMTAFITWALWHTGRLESPLLNSYLLVIITSALALGKLTTLLELALIGTCFIFLGGFSSAYELISPRYVAGMFAQFAPFVLVAYITTMFASDIRYGLNKVKLQSETDDLTGTLNRRGFAIVADRAFGQATRYSRAVSLLVIDCDNLKQVNDAHGHKAGDSLLVTLVKSVEGQLRHTDVLARHGGDEFVVLLPETPAAGALDVAERIRTAVAADALVFNGKLVRTTVSIGAASYPQDGTTLDLLLAAADRNMYQAKQAGRNRVVQKPQEAAAIAEKA